MKTDVIVAGAGPAGLMLACELRLAGVEVVLLERLPEPTGRSKALNLQPRTAEVLDLRGLLTRAKQLAFTTVPDGHFAAIPFTYEGWETRHPYQVGIPQAQVEELLTERLAELGTKVLHDHEVVEFDPDEDGVTALVRTATGDVRVHAAYLVGCDGGRSTVRKLLGVAFPGNDGEGYGVVSDVRFTRTPPGAPTEWRSMANVMATRSGSGTGSGSDFTGFIPLGEPGLLRFVYGNRTNRPDDLRAPVTADEVKDALKARYGDDVEVSEVLWASRFSDASRQAERYRVGRAFLAGDAAHIHFPPGGQGLNLGVQDAMNLGWKLAAAVNGWAPPGLLDTYESERHPVAAGVLANVAAQTALIPRTAESQALRTLFIDMATLPAVAHKLSGMVSALDIKYPTDHPNPTLGTRLSDQELKAGDTEFWSSDLFHSGKPVLITTDKDHLAEAAPWSPNLTTHYQPALPWPGTTAVLIRPDGYLSWTESATTPPLRGALETHLGTPATH